MIDFKVNEKHALERLEVSGDPSAVCANILALISAIYNALCRADVSGEAANEFQELLCVGITHKDSPVWDKVNVNGVFIIRQKEAQE